MIELEFYRPADLLVIFGISESTLPRWEKKPGFPKRRHFPHNRSAYFVRDEVDAYVRNLKQLDNYEGGSIDNAK